jgi:hypothetical protein
MFHLAVAGEPDAGGPQFFEGIVVPIASAGNRAAPSLQRALALMRAAAGA